MRKHRHNIDDYILLALPENPFLFGVERETRPEERKVKKDPKKEVGEYYDSVMHLISPYVNYYTGEPTESCTCLSWRVRQKRCVHLKAFYRRNPDLDKEDKSKIDKENLTKNEFEV